MTADPGLASLIKATWPQDGPCEPITRGGSLLTSLVMDQQAGPSPGPLRDPDGTRTNYTRSDAANGGVWRERSSNAARASARAACVVTNEYASRAQEARVMLACG